MRVTPEFAVFDYKYIIISINYIARCISIRFIKMSVFMNNFVLILPGDFTK